MSKRDFGFTIAFALGLVLALAASPAGAYSYCSSSDTCFWSWSNICQSIPHDPESTLTCGDWGTCIDLCAPQCNAIPATSTINGNNNSRHLDRQLKRLNDQRVRRERHHLRQRGRRHHLCRHRQRYGLRWLRQRLPGTVKATTTTSTATQAPATSLTGRRHRHLQRGRRGELRVLSRSAGG